MDTTFMDAVIASGTTMLTSLVGAFFDAILGILPILLGLMVIGFIVWGIRRIIGLFHRGSRH